MDKKNVVLLKRKRRKLSYNEVASINQQNEAISELGDSEVGPSGELTSLYEKKVSNEALNNKILLSDFPITFSNFNYRIKGQGDELW